MTDVHYCAVCAVPSYIADPFTRRSVQWWRPTEAGRRALEGIA